MQKCRILLTSAISIKMNFFHTIILQIKAKCMLKRYAKLFYKNSNVFLFETNKCSMYVLTIEIYEILQFLVNV